MDSSYFTSRIESTMQTLMLQMFERLLGKLDSTTAGGPTAQPAGGEFASLINQAAQKYNVNPALVQAVMKAESNFNPDAVSSVGAQGLMQLMPGTATSLGVTDALDPAQNIDGGTRYISQLLQHFNGDVRLAVAAYNAGPSAVDKYNGVPPYQETQTYVDRVLGYFSSGSNEWQA